MWNGGNVKTTSQTQRIKKDRQREKESWRRVIYFLILTQGCFKSVISPKKGEKGKIHCLGLTSCKKAFIS